MSQAALMRAIDEIFSGGYDPVAAIAKGEQQRGHRVIRPGDAPWLPATDWNPASVAAIAGLTARLVLIHAKEPGTGALTRALEGIGAAGLMPAIIDPTAKLATTLRKRGWRGRWKGNTFETREWIWRPHHPEAKEG